jgi:hypothetical protein
LPNRPALAALCGVLLWMVPSFTDAGAAQSAYPTAEVLNVFERSCASLGSTGAANAAIAASGWESVSDPATTPVAGLINLAAMAGGQYLTSIGADDSGVSLFRQSVAGEDLFLILSVVRRNGTVVRGCRMYDPGEIRQISVASATDWFGRAPDRLIQRPEIVTMTWEPGRTLGQDSTELFFVPAASPFVQFLTVSGLIFKSDFVGTEPQ